MKSRKILLVDDDESHTILSRLLLERMEYEVVTCKDAFQAVHRFRESPDEFLFVVTDYTMEPVNGLDLTRSLLQIRPGLAVLLLTGNDQPEIVTDARSAGVRAISLKPSSVEEFEDIILGMHL